MNTRNFSQPQNNSILKLNISNNDKIIPKQTSYLTPIKNNVNNYYSEVKKKIYSSTPNIQLTHFNNYNNNDMNKDDDIYNKVINEVLLYPYNIKNKNNSAPIIKNKMNFFENIQIKPFTLENKYEKENLINNPNYKYQMNKNLTNEMKRSYSSNNYFINKNDNYDNLTNNLNSHYNYNNNMIYSNRNFKNIKTRRNSEYLNSNLLNAFNQNFYNNQGEINNNIYNINNINRLNKNINSNFIYSNNNSNYFDSFNNFSFQFDLEKLFILENKILEILTNLNLHQPICNECYEWINCYFNENIYYYYLSLCKNIKNKEKLLHILKIELLNFCLCYHIFDNTQFEQYINLTKLIFEEIYYNSLIYIKFILKNTYMNNDNYIWYQNLHNKIKNEPTLNYVKILNENDMIKLLNQSIKSICYHYKKLIDLIYNSSNTKNNNNKNEKFQNETIFLFFKDFSFIENNSIEDIYDFFKFNIYKVIDPNGEYIVFDNLKKQNKYFRTYNNFYLPQNNSMNTYTLVLDLDETLIYLQRDSNIKSKRKKIIYRPYLFEFLQKMKKLYELILFSLGTPEYVDSIVETIERKERYFQYRLYRQHGKIYGNDIIKDLSKLGRDIKKIIIVDNMPQSFKLQKKNGICIKGFYGNLKDETLKDLSEILEKIRNDVNYTNDIRISLLKVKPSIILKITS